jgi:hypothetical protein
MERLWTRTRTASIMSDGDETDDGTSVEALATRLDAAAEALDAAETEADLDGVAATLDALREAFESTDLPEPTDDETDPSATIEKRLDGLETDLESARGPYAEDVAESVAGAADTIRSTRWTGDGTETVLTAAAGFAGAASEATGTDVAVEGADADAAAAALETAAEAVANAGLDPDDDAATIADLAAAADDLTDAVEAAEGWTDLEKRRRLEAEEFYDVLGHYKDFPPEWAALKEHERRGNVEQVLLALETLDSEFMERHCLEALTRMNDENAFEAMHARASKRDEPGVRALGKMAATDAVETLTEYVDADSDPQLQKVTFRALGEIGDPRATEPLAGKLLTDDDEVRSHAARALGLLGDTRAVEPLADALATDDVGTVRAAAAWALRQIGTEHALEVAAGAVDDDSPLVSFEAERAAEALGVDATDPAPPA